MTLLIITQRKIDNFIQKSILVVRYVIPRLFVQKKSEALSCKNTPYRRTGFKRSTRSSICLFIIYLMKKYCKFSSFQLQQLQDYYINITKMNTRYSLQIYSILYRSTLYIFANPVKNAALPFYLYKTLFYKHNSGCEVKDSIEYTCNPIRKGPCYYMVRESLSYFIPQER